MKRYALIATLVLAAFALWRSRPSPSHGPNRIDKVMRLASPAERKALADRISVTLVSHWRSAGDGIIAPPLPTPVPREVPTGAPPSGTVEIRDALQAVVPFLAECYGGQTFAVAASMTFSGDPDIGTIVDVTTLQDETDHPLPARLDQCVRATLQLMALPPISEGPYVEAVYPFVFRND